LEADDEPAPYLFPPDGGAGELFGAGELAPPPYLLALDGAGAGLEFCLAAPSSAGEGGGSLGALIGGKFLIFGGAIEVFLGTLVRNPLGAFHLTE
jgi:hypothetical protein